MGRFDENGVYIPRAITEDDLAGSSLEDAMVGTIVEFEDGDLVEGTVVKIDRDEVLLDIGFKSEGVIPVRELSIRNDVDPSEIVSLSDKVEALVLQKEDKEGRLILSKKRAQYERAWGTIEKLKENDEVVTGPVIEVVKGGLIVDIGLRGFLPPPWWSCAGCGSCSLTWVAPSKPRSSSSTATGTTWCCPAGPGSRRPRRNSGTSS